MGEAFPNGTNASSDSDGDGRPTDSNLPPIKVNRGSMIVKRMGELVSRYDVPLAMSEGSLPLVSMCLCQALLR